MRQSKSSKESSVSYALINFCKTGRKFSCRSNSSLGTGFGQNKSMYFRKCSISRRVLASVLDKPSRSFDSKSPTSVVSFFKPHAFTTTDPDAMGPVDIIPRPATSSSIAMRTFGCRYSPGSKTCSTTTAMTQFWQDLPVRNHWIFVERGRVDSCLPAPDPDTRKSVRKCHRGERGESRQTGIC